MRKHQKILTLVLIMTSQLAFGQLSPEFNVIQAGFKKTGPLRDILSKVPDNPLRVVRDENGLVGVPSKTAIIHPYNEQRPGQVDPLLQVSRESLNSLQTATATVTQNFNGLGYTSVNPADPVSATGPNHVIQMINYGSGSMVRITDKTGVPVISDFSLGTITGYQGAGDPIVQYDQLAGRWLLNEFGYSGGVTSYINTLFFAISATDDPLGSWYIYYFADNFFVDYQKIAVWHNAYYATSNDFNTAGNTYLGSSIYAFDRTKMLAGDATATAIRSRLTHSTGRYFSMAPVTQEGLTSSSLSGLFAFYQNDAWTPSGTDVDSIYTFEFTPNFTTPASSVIAIATQMATAALDDDLCAASREACINQTGPTSLEALTGRLMNKIIFRKFPSYESIVVCATVDASGAGRAGIRWWELRRAGGAWSIYQEGTYSPDASDRWMGAICQDAMGNIGLIYNVSSGTDFPSLRFTARNPCDAPGTMTLPETNIVAGTAANASTRYGDYNSLSIDPSNNTTFWLTGMYNAAGTWSTRIASFTLNDCTPLPEVRFQTSSLAVREKDDNVVSGCLNYRDHTVNIMIDAAPSADAILTFTTSGTALSGKDYTITPSSVTLNAANMTRTVTIRVFDDAAWEGTETLSIGYTINNNGGNAVAGEYNQSCVINFVDDEAIPALPVTIVKTWGDANVLSVTSGPFNGSSYTDKRVQNLYYSSDMLIKGLKAGSVTHFAWYINAATVATFNNLTISIGFVSNSITNLASGFQSPVFTSIYSGNFTTPGVMGWYTFTLPTPVTWNGSDNVIIQSCFDNTTTTSDVAVIGMNTAYTASALFRQNAAGTVCATAANASSVARPDIRLSIIDPGNPVATTIVSKVASLGPNEDVFFYDATGRTLARIKNNTAFDYGCTTVEIDRSGTGASAFWNNNSANYLTAKTFRVTPTNANAAGQYDITLYYTAAEKSGYEATTGSSWTAVNMVKSGGAISGITPATPLASPVSVNSVITHGSFGSDFTVKASFTNGFSGFAMGQPGTVLPVGFTEFKGMKNGKFVDLTWITGFEFNNERFEIETSKDLHNFYRIGTVSTLGNSSTDQYYSFTDKLPVTGTNYYRLKQIDLDRRSTYSRIIAVTFDEKAKLFTIYPNPAKDKLNISFAAPATNILFHVFAADGKFIMSERVGIIERNYELPVQHLAAGSYMLEIISGNDKYNIKFIKE